MSFCERMVGKPEIIPEQDIRFEFERVKLRLT